MRHLNSSALRPHQRGVCRWCGGAVTGRRRYWCGPACVDAYQLRASATVARQKVHERDNGICDKCGIDVHIIETAAVAELRRVEALPEAERATWCDSYRYVWRVLVTVGSADYDVPVTFRGNDRLIPTLWQADHIVPVAEGGGACGLENLRTLCWLCHPKETGQLRRRLNARARGERELPLA